MGNALKMFPEWRMAQEHCQSMDRIGPNFIWHIETCVL